MKPRLILNSIAAVFAALCFFPNTADAGLVTWVGGSTGSWNDTANWSTGSLPTAGCDVIIDSTGLMSPITVTGPTGGLPGGDMTINLLGGTTFDLPSGVIRLNGSNFVIDGSSGVSGNAFWDLNNGELTFNAGASFNAGTFELKGQNSFTFNLDAGGFTALTPGNYNNDGNNPADPGTLLSNDTFTVDMANYTGGTQVITLIDFTGDGENLTDAIFQMANLVVQNSGSYVANIQWNDAENAIELNVVAPVPEPTTLILFTSAVVSLSTRRRRRFI